MRYNWIARFKEFGLLPCSRSERSRFKLVLAFLVSVLAKHSIDFLFIPPEWLIYTGNVAAQWSSVVLPLHFATALFVGSSILVLSVFSLFRHDGRRQEVLEYPWMQVLSWISERRSERTSVIPMGDSRMKCRLRMRSFILLASLQKVRWVVLGLYGLTYLASACQKMTLAEWVAIAVPMSCLYLFAFRAMHRLLFLVMSAYLVTCYHYTLAMDDILSSLGRIHREAEAVNDLWSDMGLLAQRAKVRLYVSLTRLVLIPFTRLTRSLSRDNVFWRHFLLVNYLFLMPTAGIFLILTFSALPCNEMDSVPFPPLVRILFFILSLCCFLLIFILTISAARILSRAKLIVKGVISLALRPDMHCPRAVARQVNKWIKYLQTSETSSVSIGFAVYNIHSVDGDTFWSMMATVGGMIILILQHFYRK